MENGLLTGDRNDRHIWTSLIRLFPMTQLPDEKKSVLQPMQPGIYRVEIDHPNVKTAA